MTDITKQDLQDLTNAMVEGFQQVNDRFDGIDARLAKLKNHQDKSADVLDHIAGRVDDLWTENGSQVITNRRYETRISRIEAHLGLGSYAEEIEA